MQDLSTAQAWSLTDEHFILLITEQKIYPIIQGANAIRE